jgi:hypothetical protein
MKWREMSWWGHHRGVSWAHQPLKLAIIHVKHYKAILHPWIKLVLLLNGSQLKYNDLGTQSSKPTCQFT